MRRTFLRAGLLLLAIGAAAVALLYWLSRAPAVEVVQPSSDELELLAEEGKYIYDAAGCVGCHTRDEDGATELAGGEALETPFGVFFGPNITPHPVAGIGAWSAADFVRALRYGRDPGGGAYYPSFPYTSYSGMDETDMLRLYAYIMLRVDPAVTLSRPHELPWYLSGSLPARAWQWRYFRPVETRDPTRDAQWNRGAYLANALLLCGECHTPRNAMGAPIGGMYLAGTDAGPDGKKVPNITPDEENGIGGWSDRELKQFLRLGMQPDGDFVGGGMGEVIDHAQKLTDEDRDALHYYLRNIPPVSREPGGH